MALVSIVEVPWHSGPRLGRIVDITEEGFILVAFLGSTISWPFEPWDVIEPPTDAAIEQYNALVSPEQHGPNAVRRHWNGEAWDDGLKARYGI